MPPTKKRFAWSDVTSLYYITHKSNLASILKYGILSHAEIERQGIEAHTVYNQEVVNLRQSRVVDGKSLWNYANLYFQVRNPMLFQVLRHAAIPQYDEIIVLSISPEVLKLDGAKVTTGNAAANSTEVYTVAEGEKQLGTLQKIFAQEFWNSTDGSKRTIMAECLVPNVIPARLIQTVYVAKPNLKSEIDQILIGKDIHVVAEPYMFFRPRSSTRITEKLSIASGDMFFSTLQTLTVSVNTVGIMGKGLASRAKYQFPDVYVQYQDLCRKKSLQLGKPALYKRDSDLVTNDYPDIVDGKWFLLFPTKDHWKNDSRIEPIEEGLKWLLGNYKKLGIESLAIPALGCGLGNLTWGEVGPLMCKYLSQLDITCTIYLPQDKDIPEEHLRPNYLMS